MLDTFRYVPLAALRSTIVRLFARSCQHIKCNEPNCSNNPISQRWSISRVSCKCNMVEKYPYKRKYINAISRHLVSHAILVLLFQSICWGIKSLRLHGCRLLTAKKGCLAERKVIFFLLHCHPTADRHQFLRFYSKHHH